MRSEALDITIESQRGSVYLRLSGPFHNEQVPNIRQELRGLIDDGNRRIVIDMERVTAVDNEVVNLFLLMLNLIRGKGGDLKFIFKNDAVSDAFKEYRHIFSVYPDAVALAAGGFFGTLLMQGRVLSRKTGIRISRPVAIFLLVTLIGWFVSLIFIISMQYQRIGVQQQTIHELTLWKQQTNRDIQTLRERIRPFEQLGIIQDSSKYSETLPKTTIPNE